MNQPEFRAARRTTEDLQFKPVPDGVPRYAATATGPVDVHVVRNDERVLGYLWASDVDDAADFVRRLEAGDSGGNAAVYWVKQLLETKRRGVAPTEALDLLAHELDGGQSGRLVGGRSRSATLEALKAHAAAMPHKGDRGTDGSVTDVLDRAVGSLVAGAVGDALGAPVEFLATAEIRARYGPTGVIDYDVAYGRRGAITDDTQMTLFTAEALTQVPTGPGRVDELRAAYLRWLDTQEGVEPHGPGLAGLAELHRLRAPGTTCLSALRATRAGARGTVEHPINDSKGCGGVMRAAPAGIVAADVADAFSLGCALAALTHGHPSGYLPAGVLAAAVHLIIAGAALDDALDVALSHARGRPGHAETADAVETGRALASRGRPGPEDLESLGGGWTGEEALAIAVAAALSAVDLADGLLLAVNHSGDSDSTGALCGNLLGARDGLAAVPQGWLAELELRDVVIAAATALVGSGERSR